MVGKYINQLLILSLQLADLCLQLANLLLLKILPCLLVNLRPIELVVQQLVISFRR